MGWFGIVWDGKGIGIGLFRFEDKDEEGMREDKICWDIIK